MIRAGLVALALTALPCLAEEPPDTDTPDAAPGMTEMMQRGIELPSHRSLFATIADSDAVLAPFETDGCSGGMSRVWSMLAETFPDFADAYRDAPPWETCCVTHDQRYHNAAGAQNPEESYTARLVADEALRQCVGAQAARAQAAVPVQEPAAGQEDAQWAYDAIASAMFNAVRLGGAPCSGLPWRWGYGYSHCSPIPILSD